MSQNIRPPEVKLPDNLQRQFSLLQQRLWKVETAVAVCSALIGLVISYLLLFFSDRIWNSPTWFRLVLLIAGAAVSAWAAYRWLSLWIFNKRDSRALAILVQQKFRRLGDRLLGIVELSNEKERPAHFSAELYQAAIHQVAEEADKYNFREAVDKRAAKKLISTAGALILLVLLPVFVVPIASWNAFLRWIAPMAAIARYTLVKVQDLPAKIIVPHGESFDFTAAIHYDSPWKPSRASAQFEKQTPVDAKVHDGKVTFRIPGQMQKGILKIKIGDVRHEVAVEPQYRPSLKEMAANIQFPDYLQYPDTDEKIRSGSLTLLEGSRVSFQGKTSRQLQSAWLNTSHNSENLEVKADRFVSQPISSGGVSQFSFKWLDIFGLSNAAPWRLNIQTQQDQPPTPALPELSRDLAILHSDVLDIKTLSKDDYGIRDVGLTWELFSASEEPFDRATTEIKIRKKSPREKKVEEVFQWSPAVFRIGPDTLVELVAFATDYFPGRERAESTVYRIHVLGNEKHADLVRQNLESVLARIEEVARLEEKILAKTAELNDDEKLSAKDAAGKIGKAGEEQQQNAKNLESLAKEGMEALREALKNPIFKEEMLQQWSKNLKEMQQLAQGKMKEAAGDLKSAQQSAQQNASDKESQKKQLSEAKKKEEEILAALEAIQGKVNKDLDDLQALTLSERLRRTAAAEEEISGELKKTIPETIGLLPKELPEKFRKIDTRLANGQEEVQKEAYTLQGEINRFYERTQKPNYGEASKEMNELRASEELDRVRSLIQENVGMEATRNLLSWAKHFNKWADKLEPPPSESPSGQSQSGQSAMNMTKTLLLLLRIREKELNIHSQTVLLDEQKPNLKDYPDRAHALLSTQQDLTKIFKEVEGMNKLPMLVQPYKETGQGMNKIESLLQVPQTDKVTAQAEVKTVELLSDLINLINEQAQRNPPPPGQGSGEENSAEQMAFLMQMLAPSQGMSQGMAMNQGGGNPGGGSTNRENTPPGGDAQGKSGEERRVNRASGAASLSLPTEFRETLEDYFKALEQEPN